MIKYTGSRGKSSANDANAEYIGKLRKLLDVVDLGVPVLSMHAPFEIVSKTDVYMTYKAYETFYNKFV